MTDDETTTARTLFETARDDPDAVDPGAARDLLNADRPTARRFALDALVLLTSYDPDGVRDDLAEDFAGLESAAADPDPTVRASAATLIGRLALPDPDVLAATRDAVQALLADEDPLVREKVLSALDDCSARHPAAVSPFAEAIAVRLEDDPLSPAAVGALARASTVDPTAATDSLAPLLELLVEGTGYDPTSSGASRVPRAETTSVHRGGGLATHRSVRQLAGHAVVQVAAADPDRVAPAAGDVAALLDDADGQVQAVAADVLVALVGECPDAVAPHLDALRERLGAPEDYVRARSAQALAGLAPADGDVASAALDHRESVADLLDHDEPPVRGAAASLLAIAVEREPTAVDPAADRLRSLREDDAEPDYVRAAAADALAALE